MKHLLTLIILSLSVFSISAQSTQIKYSEKLKIKLKKQFKINGTLSDDSVKSFYLTSYKEKDGIYDVYCYGVSCISIKHEDEEEQKEYEKTKNNNSQALNPILNTFGITGVDEVTELTKIFSAYIPPPTHSSRYYNSPRLINLDIGFSYSTISTKDQGSKSLVGLPINAMVDFHPGSDKLWPVFNYLNVRTIGQLNSSIPLDLDAENLSIIKDVTNDGDVNLTAVQEYGVPDITDLIQLSKFNVYLGLNIFHFSKRNNRRSRFHVGGDFGFIYINTPTELLGATDLVDDVQDKIFTKIEEVQSELSSIDDGIFGGSEAEKEELRNKISLLSDLSDKVIEIPKDNLDVKDLTDLTSVSSRPIWYYGPSINTSFVFNSQLNIQAFAQMLFPTGGLKTNDKLLDIQATETINLYGLTEEVLNEFLPEIGLNNLDIDQDKFNTYKQQFVNLGIQTNLMINNKLEAFANYSLLFSNNSDASSARTFTIGVRSHLSIDRDVVETIKSLK